MKHVAQKRNNSQSPENGRKKTEIYDTQKQLLRNSKSIGFIGVFIAIKKKEPNQIFYVKIYSLKRCFIIWSIQRSCECMSASVRAPANMTTTRYLISGQKSGMETKNHTWYERSFNSARFHSQFCTYAHSGEQHKNKHHWQFFLAFLFDMHKHDRIIYLKKKRLLFRIQIKSNQ